MEAKEINQCLEIDSDDSISSDSDIEVKLPLKKLRSSIRKLSKKSSNHEAFKNVQHAYDQRTETKVDINTRSNISVSEDGIAELNGKKGYGTLSLDESYSARSSVNDVKYLLNCNRHTEDVHVELKPDNEVHDLNLMQQRIYILSNLFPDYKYTCSILSNCGCGSRGVKSPCKSVNSPPQSKIYNSMCCLEKQKLLLKQDFENWPNSGDDSDGNEYNVNPRRVLDISQNNKTNKPEQEQKRAPSRKRKPQNKDDYEVKQVKNSRRSSNIKMKLKLKSDSKSGRGHWKVSESAKKVSPKSKEETDSKSVSTPDKQCTNKCKTPTKQSAKKNLFSPERSPEHSNQLPVSFTNTPNIEQEYTNNLISLNNNKSNNNSTTPKIDMNSDFTSNAYELRNKTPMKQNENDKNLNTILVEHGDENEVITALTAMQDDFKTTPQKITRSSSKKIAVDDKYDGLILDNRQLKVRTPLKEIESSPSKGKLLSNLKSLNEQSPFKTVSKDLNDSTPTTPNSYALTAMQDDFKATPQKITRSNSKKIAVDDKYDGLFLDNHQLKVRTPLKEIESSPSKGKLSSNLKSVNEQSPFKTVSKYLNDSTPTTPNRLGRTNVSSLHAKFCKNLDGQEMGVSNTATPGKDANSPNFKQEPRGCQRTPRKRLALDSSPYRQNNLLPSSPASMKCGTLIKNVMVKLDRIKFDDNSLTSRSPLKIIKESSNKELNSPETVKGKHFDFEKLTLNKNHNQGEHRDYTNYLSPSKHVQLKKCASPMKNMEITVTTPVSKKKEGRGYLTPSMAKRTHETSGRGDDALDMTRKQLHISTIPKSLPCRDAEFSQIKSFLVRKIEHSAGGCMYISGVPGTGKTATVHAVIRALQENVKEGDLSEFDFVEVNGLRLTEPRQAYVRIYQALTNQKLTSDQAQQLLNKRFSGSCKRSTIILVDELDYLCNRRQDVVYNILDWPSKRSSALVVLTISNTMDLPERTLKGRVTSRMGLTRLTFQPYTHHQLKEIVEDRLSGSTTFHPDAIQLVARKVAAVSGDARRALDICRRTTELVHGCGEQITVTHIEEALLQLCAGARVQVIKSLSGLGQLVLRSVRDVCQRTGVDETTAASVYKHLRQLAIFEGGEVPNTGALLQTCVTLVGLGLIVAEKGRVDLTRKMSLNVSSDDIHYALDNIKL